jgi:hypothetical protein
VARAPRRPATSALWWPTSTAPSCKCVCVRVCVCVCVCMCDGILCSYRSRVFTHTQVLRRVPVPQRLQKHQRPAPCALRVQPYGHAYRAGGRESIYRHTAHPGHRADEAAHVRTRVCVCVCIYLCVCRMCSLFSSTPHTLLHTHTHTQSHVRIHTHTDRRCPVVMGSSADVENVEALYQKHSTALPQYELRTAEE